MAEPTPAPEPTPTPEPDTSINSQAKELQWVKDMGAELKALKDKDAAREAADADAASKAEQDKLTAAGKFDEAKALYEQRIKDTDATHKAELAKRDLKAELAMAGFEKRGVDLLTTEYDAKTSGSIADYVKAALADDGNKPFIGKTRLQFRPPTEVVEGGGTGSLTNEQIRAMQKSAKQEDRLAAQAYLSRYYDEHKGFPSGFTDG